MERFLQKHQDAAASCLLCHRSNMTIFIFISCADAHRCQTVWICKCHPRIKQAVVRRIVLRVFHLSTDSAQQCLQDNAGHARSILAGCHGASHRACASYDPRRRQLQGHHHHWRWQPDILRPACAGFSRQPHFRHMPVA